MGRLSTRLKKFLGSKKKDGAGSSSPKLVEQSPSASRTSSALSSPPSQSQQGKKKVDNVNVVEREVSSESASAKNAAVHTDEITAEKELRHEQDGEPDLWEDAFHLLEKREPELAADYLKHIHTSSGNSNGTTNSDANTSKSLVSKGRSAEPVIRHLLANREKKQWRIPLLDKDIRIRAQAEKLIKFCLFTDEIVKQALSCQPCAALAWSGVSILLPLITSGKAQHSSMLDGFNFIGEVQLYWKIYEKEARLRYQPRNHDVRQALTKLYSHIVEYQARVICHLSSAQLSRSWQKLSDSNNWEGQKQSIAKMDKHCSRLVSESDRNKVLAQRDSQLQEIQESRAIQSQILEAIQEANINAEKRHRSDMESAMLRDLSSDYEHFKNIHPDRVDGTCEWLFSDGNFRKWRASTASSLLWVSASPGCGKSVLTRSLIDENRLSNNAATSIVCYFFFQTGIDGQRESASALAALIHQLLLQDPAGDMIQKGLASHKNFGEKLKGNFAELWRLLVACANAYPSGEIIIVLDALDECGEESREKFLQNLDTFFAVSAQTSRLKFLITSRPYDDLESAFRKHATRPSYLHVDADEKAAEIEKEINLVIDSKVQEFAQDFSEAHRTALADRLKTMESRTYLWLHLTFDIIKKRRAFFTKSSQIQDLLNSIPSKVSDAYEQTLNRISEEEGDRAMTHSLLEIVLAATRPLTLDEANYALTLKTNPGEYASQAEIDDQLWPKGGFKSVVKNLSGLLIMVCDSRLTFIHLTAREFLTDQNKQGQWRGCLTMENSHGTMASVCIDYLTAVDPGMLEGNLESFAESYPFLLYSLVNWSLHFISQKPSDRQKLCERSRKLCSTASGRGERLGNMYGEAGTFNWGIELDSNCELHLACALGLESVVASILKDQDTTSEAFAGIYRLAIAQAAFQGYPDVVRTLMKNAQSLDGRSELHSLALAATLMRMDGSDIQKAAVLSVLLDNDGDIHILDLQVTLSAMGIASADVVSILLERLGNEIFLTEDVLLSAASNFHHGDEVMALLLDKRGHEFAITESLLRSAAGNFTLAKEIVTLLMDRRGNEVRITDAVVLEAAQNGDPDLLAFFLEKCPNVVNITEELLTEVLDNRHCGSEMTRLLFQYRGNEIAISEKMINAAARNAIFGLQLLQSLLDQGVRSELLTTQTLEIAAKNSGCGGRMMEWLLDQTGSGIYLSDAILEGAADNLQQGQEVLKCVLMKRGGEIAISERMLEKAADNYRCGAELVELMLDFDRNVRITEKVVEHAAGNFKHGNKIMALILQNRGKQFPVSAKARQEAAANRGCGAEILTMLESAQA